MPASFEVPSALRQATQAISATRGRALQLRSVFDQSRIPMIMVDGGRRLREVNTAARLLSRLPLEEARQHTIDDFTVVDDRPQLIAAWERLMRDGTVSDPYLLTFQDGSQLRVLYAAIANALPGLHLIIFLPADWPGDELEDAPPAGSTRAAPALSRRQLEVLRLVAVGANAAQIAEELSISEATVRTHVKHILERLGANNRSHAVALAMTQGLLGDTAGPDSEPNP